MSAYDNLNSFDECIRCGCDYSEKDNLNDAFFAFNKAVSLARTSEQYSLGYLNRGVVYARQNRYQEAAGDFGEALRQDPNNSQAKQMLQLIIQNGDMVSRSMAERYLGYR